MKPPPPQADGVLKKVKVPEACATIPLTVKFASGTLYLLLINKFLLGQILPHTPHTGIQELDGIDVRIHVSVQRTGRSIQKGIMTPHMIPYQETA